MADRIVLLKDSDILSESMHKINYNFKLLENDTAVNDYRWQQYVNSIDKKIDGLKNATDSRENAIARNLDSLQDLIDSMATKEDIQNQINNALQNANDELRGFISTAVGQQVSKAYGTFATTSQLYEELGKLNYVRSDAFDVFEAKVNERMASASRIVANSKFAEQDGHLVYTDNTVSPYTSIDDYWNSLDSATKASLDPQGKGLKDPEVLEAFMNYCERKFLTVYTELSAIRQIVGAGEANTEIMTAIKGPNGKDIVAAIFETANEEGSGILMTADHIQIDGKKLGLTADDILISPEHRLGLVAGQITFTSNNFGLDTDGKIWATGADLSGNITANSFKTSTGMTFMDSDGVLHASNAVIDGDITAKRFNADWTGEVNGDGGVTGHLTKNTSIDGQSFNIGITNGTLTTPSGTYDPTGNSLYIKLADAVPNQGSNMNPAFGSYLYGVPVLCMMYNGVEYMISPASWFNPTGGSGDTSNMRFIKKYDAVHCIFNGIATELRNYCIQTTQGLGDGVTSTVYIFRPDVSKGGKTFITMGISNGKLLTDTVYQFTVLNWGTADNSVDVTKRDMLNGGSKPLLSSTNPINGVYTLQSAVGTEGTKFTGSGGVQTTVTPENRTAMISYLPKINNYSLGIKFNIPESGNDMNEPLPTSYSINKIGKLMTDLLKYNGNFNGVSGLWKTNAFRMANPNSGSGYNHSCIITSGNASSGKDLGSNLPYEGNLANKQHFFDFNVDYYPVCTLDTYGKNHSNGTNYVIGNCKMNMMCKYPEYSTNRIKVGVTYTDTIDYTVGYFDSSNVWHSPNDVEFYVDEFYLTLEFSFVLQFNNAYTNYNPNSAETHHKIVERVVKFLEDYQFSDIKSNYNSDFANYVKLTGYFTGDNNIVVELVDRLN